MIAKKCGRMGNLLPMQIINYEKMIHVYKR